MRPTFFAALTLTMLTLAACGDETPPPQAPPAPPPPATASATPPPADTTPPPPPPKPALSELIPKTLEQLKEANEAHDTAKLATLVTDDVALYFYGSALGGETHGKAAYVERAATSAQHFSGAKLSVTRVFIKGNVAVVEVTMTGMSTPPASDPKATSRPFGQKRAIVFFFDDDGRVKEEHIYADTPGLVAQTKGEKKAPPVEPASTAAPEVHLGKGTPDEDRLVDWAKKVDDTFNTHDAKQAIALLADDVQYEQWGAPTLKGKKENAKDLQAYFKAFPDQKWTPTNVWGADGFVIIEHVFTGTQKVPYGRTTKPTGKPITGWHFLEIWQPTADGKFAHGWSYSNYREALEQTGGL